jgi:hypothetical protein
MSENYFIRELATSKFISNVASFCSECYNHIHENEVVFYNIKSCCYLCDTCQEKYQKSLNKNSEYIFSNSSLFY